MMSSTRLRTRASTVSLPSPLRQCQSNSEPERDSSEWRPPRVCTPRMGHSFAGDMALNINIPPVPRLSYLEPDTPTSPTWDLPEIPLDPLLETCSFDRKSHIISDIQVHQPEGLGWRHSTVSTLTPFRRSSASTIATYRQSGASTITSHRISTASTITPSSEDRKRKANDLPLPKLWRCSINASKDRRTSLRNVPEHVGWGDLQSPIRLYFADVRNEVERVDQEPVMKRRRGTGWLSRTPNLKSKMRTVQI